MLKSARLTTERLVLRPFKESDKTFAFEIFFDELVKKTYMIPDFNNEKEAEMLFNKLCENSHSAAHFVYAICLEETLIGFINDCYLDARKIELGYVLNSRYHGQGYMTEALKTAIKELFRLGYVCVEAGYFIENTASRRVMEKCQMRPIAKEEDIIYKGVVHHCKFCAIEKGK